MAIEANSTIRALLAAALLCAAAHTNAAPGDDEDAAGSVDRARALWKEGATLHLEEDYPAAIARYRSALRLRPTARTHTYLAWSLSRLGRYREAVRNCRRAIELDPGYPNAYNDLGSYLIDLGRPGDAIPWLKRAAQFTDYCCPHYIHYQLGRAMLLQARVEDARRELETALAIRPNYTAARRLLRSIETRGLKGL